MRTWFATLFAVGLCGSIALVDLPAQEKDSPRVLRNLGGGLVPIDNEPIYRALAKETKLEFLELPLDEVAEYLGKAHQIDVVLDTLALQDDGIDSQTPITINLSGISLRSGLRLMLEPLGLTYLVQDEVLMITTPTKAESQLRMGIYPVADLVAQRDPKTQDVTQDHDSLIELITNIVAPASWDIIGGPCSVAPVNATLVIAQTEDGHGQVVDLLATLRTCQSLYTQSPSEVSNASLYEGDDSRDAIRRKLQQRITVDWRKVPLTEVAQYLSDTLKVPFVIDTLALQDDGIDVDVPVSARATNARVDLWLRRVLDELGLRYVIADEVVQITTPSKAEEKLLDRLYPVYDLVENDADELTEAIVSVVARDSWDYLGGPGGIVYWPRPASLMISTTGEIHEQIETLLAELRKAQAEYPMPDTTPFVAHESTKLELQVYCLPTDKDGKTTLQVDRVVNVISQIVASDETNPVRGSFVEIIADNQIALRQTSRMHKRIQQTLQELGVARVLGRMSGGIF